MSVHRFCAMGCEVVVGGATDDERTSVERLFAALEQALSRFRPDSDLQRLNRASADAVFVTPILATSIDDALRAAVASDGLVDPTIADAIRAAGYDRTFEHIGDAPVSDPSPAGRWREIRVAGCLVRRPAGLRLDLNGVAKGRAVDDALALLEGDGFVSAGGDLATRGELAVSLPGDETVTLASGALATSGITTRSWERAGRRAHHLIDPSTGAPADVRWECVTVCAATCLAADVAAKTAFLLGDGGPDWLERHGLDGRFVAESEVVVTRGWPAPSVAPRGVATCT